MISSRVRPLLGSGPDATDAIAAVGTRLAEADALLRGVPGLRLLLAESSLGPALVHHCGELLAAVEQEEQRLEQDGSLSTKQLEARNQALIAVRDGVWAITATGSGPRRSSATSAAVRCIPGRSRAFLSIHQALSAIDRRGPRPR